MSVYYYGQSSKDSKWYFRLKDNNNETILSSTEGYNTKQGCLNGIESVKNFSRYDQYYHKFMGSDSRFYFTLKASNGEPIGKSEGYFSSSDRDNGVANCKKEAPTASMKELAGSFS